MDIKAGEKEVEMTPKERSRKSDRMAMWMLLLVFVITGIVFLWSSSNYQQNDATVNTYVDDAGHLHVLGVSLGESSLNQAEDILKSKSDVALYIYPQGHVNEGLRLEAFFPAIADHTKVVLLLDINDQKLRDIESRATIPHLYPNKIARMNLDSEDVIRVHHAIVRELTLIPNLTLSFEMLKARFGKPDRVQVLNKGLTQYEYDAIGLTALLSEEEPPQLHFSTSKMSLKR